MSGEFHNLSVVHIGPGLYTPGDSSHVTYGIWKELASGFRDYHVVGRSTAKAAQWSDENLHITLLPTHTAREAEFLFTQFLALPLIVRAKPDVIVCQSPVLGGFAALSAARTTGARTLMELHGMEFFTSALVGSRLWFLQRLSYYALHRSDRIRVLSEGMREALARSFGSGLLQNTSILPPRVDTARFKSPAIERMRRPLRIVMVGAINSNKGQLRLISALHSIDFPLELELVGDGPDLAACQAKAASLASEGSLLRLLCHGKLPHHDVADVLAKTDLVIIFSRTEATPRVLMEGLASGCPVITTNVGFCAELLQNGVEGFVLGTNPDREIVYLLAQFNADRSLISSMGTAARTRAVRDYDSVRLFDDYRRLIADTARA